MSDAFELEICQGKYRYRYEAGKQEVWRNGEPWEVMNGRLIGDKFVFSLAIELDEAIKERDALRAELSKQQALTDSAQHIAEVAQSRANRLQAKITEMERQEPVRWFYVTNGEWDCYSRGRPPEDAYDAGSLMALYALPGAQAMLRVPDAVMAALENLDDYIARIEGNDRGACSHINLVRRYLLDAAGVEGNK